jgi:hypothetical protein
MAIISITQVGGYSMKRSKNILTDKEMELVSLLMADCQSTGDIQTKLKRLFAGTEQLNKCWNQRWTNIWATKKTALKATTVEIRETDTIAKPSSATMIYGEGKRKNSIQKTMFAC